MCNKIVSAYAQHAHAIIFKNTQKSQIKMQISTINNRNFEKPFRHPSNRTKVVSPAYGFSALALVKCSNEGGPGPRHNMKEDPGTSTLVMKREHGQEVPCDPGQVTSILGSTCPPLPPPPPTRAARTEHPPTPF
jgi:hypothetical protein